MIKVSWLKNYLHETYNYPCLSWTGRDRFGDLFDNVLAAVHEFSNEFAVAQS